MPAGPPPLPAQFPMPYGRYVLTGALGRGGMAEIFLAQQQGPHGFQREVVVKRILPHISDDDEFVRMFIQEAKLTARLVHPNIVQVLDFGEEAGQLFLAMEFVDGTDVRALLRALRKSRELLDVEIACHVVMELARGLDHAHRLADPVSGDPLGLVHRDISPSNVLLSCEGAVKLCDFGIAHVGSEAMTRVGTLKGKYGYMSPEQATGRPIDARSDVFSLGALFWELLAARRLYGADSELGVLELARNCEPRPLPRTDLPMFPALAATLERALARDPDQRYDRASELAKDLAEYLRAVDLYVSTSELAATLQKYCPTELGRSREVRKRALTQGTGTGTGSEPSFGVAWQSVAEDPPPFIPITVDEDIQPVVEAPRASQPPPQPTAVQPAPRASRVDDLARILLQSGVVTQAQLQAAREAAARSGRTVVFALLAMRVVSDSDLAHAFGVLLDLPVVDLAKEVVLDAVARRIPGPLAVRLSAIPFRVADSGMGRPTLHVAFANPASLGSVPEIEFATGMKIRPYIARQAAVLARIRRAFYGEDLPVPPLSPSPELRGGGGDPDGGEW
ncbi:MAG: protein kinase [Deltaproteobacteria bacterium]|nr:protein kinase [Deltaproteobacteria bacterium]